MGGGQSEAGSPLLPRNCRSYESRRKATAQQICEFWSCLRLQAKPVLSKVEGSKI
jgi:hypothetical protein